LKKKKKKKKKKKLSSGAPGWRSWCVRGRCETWSSRSEEDGRLAAVVGVARDIRERKRAEEALRESEARFRMATEEALAGVYIIQDGKFQYVNPALARIFGYTPQELMGKLGPLDLTHPQDRPLVEKNIRKRLKGEVRAVHYTLLGRHIEYQGRPAIMGNLLDITERVQAEEALRESEARYRTLVENANEGIVVVQDGLIKFTNPKFRELSGCTESDLACKHFTEFLHPEERAAALERYQKRMKGETVPSVYSFRAIDKQGKVRWVESKAVLITWEGKPAVLNFLSDITGRAAAQLRTIAEATGRDGGHPGRHGRAQGSLHRRAPAACFPARLRHC